MNLKGRVEDSGRKVNTLPGEVKDLRRDLMLLHDSSIQGSGGFGEQELRLFQQSFPLR